MPPYWTAKASPSTSRSMHHPFVPAVCLLVLPAAAVAAHYGRLSDRRIRAALIGLALVVAGWSIAAGGMDYSHLKSVKMLIAAGTAAALFAHARGRLQANRSYRFILGSIAAAAALVYSNFLAFHGARGVREFVHLHDVAHYYLGAKYFGEIAHADLYIAMLRAEADRYGAHTVIGRARDLRTNQLVEARDLLRDSNPVKASFTPTRWHDFQDDVGFFHDTLRGQYRKLLHDHGYNATPMWTVVGGALANLVPAGSNTGIRALTLIDPILSLAILGAIAWAFGIETALIAAIYLCVLFGASFGWLGGAVLRHLWFAAFIGSACLLHRRQGVLAGGLLALSILLRVFPSFFAAGLVAKAFHEWRAGKIGVAARCLVALAVAGCLLFAATTATPRGLDSWSHFRTNMQRHVQNTAFNTIGFTRLAQPIVGDPQPERETFTLDTQLVYRLQLITLFPLTLLWLYRRARHATDLEAMALGFLPVFAGIDLACYYYVALLLLVLVLRARPTALALLFGAEAISYSMRLFEDQDSVIFFYRNVVVLLLLIGAQIELKGTRTSNTMQNATEVRPAHAG